VEHDDEVWGYLWCFTEVGKKASSFSFFLF